MGRFFISYTRSCDEGRAWAKRIADAFTDARLECFIDASQGGPGYDLLALQREIREAPVLLSLASAAGEDSEWLFKEAKYALERGVPVWPVRVTRAAPLPLLITNLVAFDLDDPERPDPLADLVERARALDPKRAQEIAYLQRLLTAEALEEVSARWTPLAAESRRGNDPERLLVNRRDVRIDFDLLLEPAKRDEAARPATPYGDVLDALADSPRLVLLGEPGAGKSYSLLRIARDRARTALEDPRAPLPVIVRLREWTGDVGAVSVERLVARQMAALSARPDDGPWDGTGNARDAAGAAGATVAARLPELLAADRVCLLVDGLNELPVASRAERAAQVRRLVASRRRGDVVVTCRRLDYDGDPDLHLKLDTLEIRPLDPPRVRQFVAAYLRDEPGSDPAALFWHLAGGERVRDALRAWQENGATEAQFWTVEDMRAEVPEVYRHTSGQHDADWHAARHDPRSLLRLVETPYMLVLVLLLYVRGGLALLGSSRASLFGSFVAILLKREVDGFLERNPGAGALPGRAGLEDALAALAWDMQHAAGPEADGGAQLVLAEPAVLRRLSREQLAVARAANLLAAGDPVQFGHQLLQEYFAARAMHARIRDGALDARTLWPGPEWWRPTGWEEAAVFLAGFEPEEPGWLLDWLADAQPAVLAKCLLEGGVRDLAPAEANTLRARWTARTSPDREPDPRARNAVALALGRLGLDDRRGVGLGEDGVPDIEWVAVPAGPCVFQDAETVDLPAFHIARYPVTNAQFQAFVDDGGYAEERWWKGLSERVGQPSAPRWEEPNRPRETVSWYEAVAFCRWLSSKLGFEVRLPVEQEWEKAARGEKGLEYPWGDGYRSGYANVDETGAMAGAGDGEDRWYLRETSAVGLYPQGASPYGVLDLSGNVWEWCLNVQEEPDARPESMDLRSDAARVLRGGSWVDFPVNARASFRYWIDPAYRHYGRGFRVLCASPVPP